MGCARCWDVFLGMLDNARRRIRVEGKCRGQWVAGDGSGMMHDRIISEGQARQIRRNDLRQLAMEKHAAELKDATGEHRAEILARIEREIEEELRGRRNWWGFLIH